MDHDFKPAVRCKKYSAVKSLFLRRNTNNKIPSNYLQLYFHVLQNYLAQKINRNSNSPSAINLQIVSPKCTG